VSDSQRACCDSVQPSSSQSSTVRRDRRLTGGQVVEPMRFWATWVAMPEMSSAAVCRRA